MESMSSASISRAGSGMSQISAIDCFELSKPYKFDSKEAMIINRRISEMIAVDNQPISIVEDVGFSRLMKEVKPRYQLPSRKWFMNTMLPQLQAEIMTKVNHNLEDCDAFSFTSDGWTNNNDKCFFSFTCQGIRKSTWERFIFVLAAKPFDVSHTGQNIKDALVEVSTSMFP